MKTARILALLSFSCMLTAPVFAQSISGGSCAASNLTGTYTLTLSGRAITPAGGFASSIQGVGTMTFDGKSGVIAAGTLNSSQALGQKFTFAGTYTTTSNCYVTMNLTTGSTATFAAVVWSSGTQFSFTGADANYVYSGNGTNNQPACATSTLSGEYSYNASGFTLSGMAPAGAADESGVLQFDGQGNVTSSYTITSAAGSSTALTATGTYLVSSNCLASATLADSTGKANTLNLGIKGAYGQNVDLLEANSGFLRLGAAHSTFLNPSQSIANVASYAISATPPGSVFALFGIGLATANKNATATSLPLPTTLLTTKVTVNGETAPLFYVNSSQIDAQMPLDIPGNTVASVIVTNGTAASNAAAVFVPAAATPGLSVYGNNRAFVINLDGNANSPTDAAAVGDEVIAYFTGGGPVTASGKLTTGAASPAGLSSVTGSTSVTVGGANATVEYIGLTPGSVGLYQANFLVPQIAKGTYPVVLTIGGQASNTLGGTYPNPVMTISN